MQKVVLIFFGTLLISCTILKKNEPVGYTFNLFDSVKNEAIFAQNKQINIVFKSCRSILADGSEGKLELQKAFKEKYGVELAGLSNLTVANTYVHDSSFYVSDEICQTISGNPITKEKMKVATTQTWEFEKHFIGHSH